MASEPMHCYRHPRRETRVSCATCGRPICTECMVATDVGIKCPEDARLPRGARAGVMKNSQILRSFLAGIGVVLVGVLVVYAIVEIRVLTLILSAAAGYGAGTLIHRAGGRNGGPVAMIISGVAVALAFLLQWLLSGTPPFSVQFALSAVAATVVAVVSSR